MRLFRLRSSLRAHPEIEQWRADAQALRESDPSLYRQILTQATSAEAEAAARDDPDAFVAIFLAKAKEAGVIGDRSEDDEPRKSDREYWPDLDLEGLLDTIGDAFQAAEDERGGPLVYPKWWVRRYVAIEVLREAGLQKRELNGDLLRLFGSRESLREEDPELDEGLERLLRVHHLQEPVQIIIQSLTQPRRPAVPAGTVCACCGSADIEPSRGSIGGSQVLCRDCGGLVINADFEVDRRLSGETTLFCPVHGSKTLG